MDPTRLENEALDLAMDKLIVDALISLPHPLGRLPAISYAQHTWAP